MPDTIGTLIIDAVIRAAALQSAIPEDDGTFCFCWRANAVEQIEAAVAARLPEYQAALKDLANGPGDG